MASLRPLLKLSAAVAALVTAAPTEAHACSIACEDFDWTRDIFPVNADAVASDGVLVFNTDQGGDQPAPDLASAMTLTVTLDDQPVPGTVEATGVPGVLVWRPDAPLQAGAEYVAVGALENPPETNPGECVYEAELPLDFTFSAVGPAEPLVAPSFLAAATSVIVESDELADLVCCDGAYPMLDDCVGGTEWTVGSCAANKGVGYLDLEVELTSQPPAVTAGLLATSIRFDGAEVFRGIAPPTFAVRRDAPACIVVEQINLATGDKAVADELCIGQDLVALLGPQTLDPAVLLGGQCTSPLYTCEFDADEYPVQWDEEKCADLDPAGDSEGQPTTSDTDGPGEPESEGSDGPSESDDTKGCGCTSTAADPGALLGLLALAGLARRRRR